LKLIQIIESTTVKTLKQPTSMQAPDKPGAFLCAFYLRRPCNRFCQSGSKPKWWSFKN